jgi:hypothetical protein
MDDINKRNSVFMIKITCFQYCLFEIHYIEVMVNNSKITFIPTMQIENLVFTAAIKAKEGHVFHFAPAVRKRNSGTWSGSKNIFLAGCFWVNIATPKKGLNFEQRQNEADILLAGFRQRLQEYNMSPSYIVSTGYGYTVYICTGRPFLTSFPQWRKIQMVLTKMAKVGRPAEKITGFVPMPGTFNHEDPDNPKNIEIIHEGHCLPSPEINFDETVRDVFGDKLYDWYEDQMIYDAIDLHNDQVAQVLQRISEDYS